MLVLLVALLASAHFRTAAGEGAVTGAPSTSAPDNPYLEVVSHRYPAVAMLDSVGTIYQAVAMRRGFFVLTGRGLYHSDFNCSSKPDASARRLKFTAVDIPAAVRAALVDNAGSSQPILTGHSETLALVTPSSIFVLNCSSDALLCIIHAAVEARVGQVSGAAADPDNDAVWVCSALGLFRWQPQQGLQQLLDHTPNVTVVAISAVRKRVAVASKRRLYQYDLNTTKLLRWDWITDVVAGQGGVIDDTITSLSYAPDGVLWIGTASCLNVLYNDGTVSRIAGKDGLPMSNHTTIDASTWLSPHPTRMTVEERASERWEYPVRNALLSTLLL